MHPPLNVNIKIAKLLQSAVSTTGGYIEVILTVGVFFVRALSTFILDSSFFIVSPLILKHYSYNLIKTREQKHD